MNTVIPMNAALPISGKVILVEDEPLIRQRLESGLAEAGLSTCGVAGSIEEFEQLVSSQDPDVVSIDWELSGYYSGNRVLEVLRQKRPCAAGIVFTRHYTQRTTAMQATADAFLVKPPGREIREWKIAIADGVRLCIARRLAKALQCRGEGDIPELSWGHALDPDAEQKILRRSRSCAMKDPNPREEMPEICDLLQRRGLWLSFDADQYITVPWPVRLRLLIRYSGIAESELTRILGIDPAEAKLLLTGNWVPADLSDRFSESADMLLSVLGYVLRLSQYEPTRMPELCRATGLHADSLSPPPWRDASLLNYLVENGVRGLKESLFWVRER